MDEPGGLRFHDGFKAEGCPGHIERRAGVREPAGRQSVV